MKKVSKKHFEEYKAMVLRLQENMPEEFKELLSKYPIDESEFELFYHMGYISKEELSEELQAFAQAQLNLEWVQIIDNVDLNPLPEHMIPLCRTYLGDAFMLMPAGIYKDANDIPVSIAEEARLMCQSGYDPKNPKLPEFPDVDKIMAGEPVRVPWKDELYIPGATTEKPLGITSKNLEGFIIHDYPFQKAEDDYFKATAVPAMFGIDPAQPDQEPGAFFIFKRDKVVARYLSRNEGDEDFHKLIMDTAKYYGSQVVEEDPDQTKKWREKMNKPLSESLKNFIVRTDWDKECDRLIEYLDWCTEKRLINKLFPDLTCGPLPGFSEWKTSKLFADWMNRPKYELSPEFKKLYPNWGMELHTPPNLLPIIKSV
jgi:hypothetical protein